MRNDRLEAERVVRDSFFITGNRATLQLFDCASIKRLFYVVYRQADSKGYPFPFRIISDHDPATMMLFDESLGDSETQAGSLGFGGKKRVEYFFK